MKRLALVLALLPNLAFAAPPETMVIPTHLISRAIQVLQAMQVLGLDRGDRIGPLLAELSQCTAIQAEAGKVMSRGQCPEVLARLKAETAPGAPAP